MRSPEPRRRRRWIRWLVAAVVVVVVLAVGGPFVYIHLIEGTPPKKLTLPTATTNPAPGNAPSSATIAGTYHVGPGSVVGYRVNEVLFGQNNTAVGRTSAVTGQVDIDGTTVTSGSLTVPMATVKSDQSQRDNQFRGRIMDVSSYPTATFTLTKPITLAGVPEDGVATPATATGQLTLHGQTRPVTMSLETERTSSGFDVQGDVPVKFSDYGIPSPSLGGTISVTDHGTMEFLLVFAPGAAAGAPTTATTTPGAVQPSGPPRASPTTVPPLTLEPSSG